MTEPELTVNQRYTYADYAAWHTEEKYELFDGVPVMQARPALVHQRIERDLTGQLAHYLRDKTCEVFPEIEVLLPDRPEQNSDTVCNVFVPDITVICEPEKLTKQYCFGAPTVIMEILSPATVKYDRVLKLNHYQRGGIPEYWIVSPEEGNAMVFLLRDGSYHAEALYTWKDTAVPVHMLPGCLLDLSVVLTKPE